MDAPSSSGPDALRQLAVALLDDFAANIVQQAARAGLRVPSAFFDWVAGDGTLLVEHRVRQRFAAAPPPGGLQAAGLAVALRCGVRYWVAPPVVAKFEALRPFFPELPVGGHGRQVMVLLRRGQWRCPSGEGCAWKLCA